MKKKLETKKRHLIELEKVGESKTSPGYFKYKLKIQEKNGEISVQPAYGKDAQDAISRLVWNERVDKISNNKMLTNGMIIAWLLTVIIPSIISSMTESPIWVLLGILTSVLIGFFIVIIEKYFNKKNFF